jgi:hypothetical protein
MDQGLAAIFAALIAFGGAALTGLVGVAIGSRISANASREAAGIAATAAHESAVSNLHVAERNREDADATRFADRIRTLAADILGASDSFAGGVSRRRQAIAWRWPDDFLPPEPVIDLELQSSIREMRLIARLPATYDATVELGRALLALEEAWQWAEDEEIDVRIATFWDRAARFEEAVRAELGRPCIKLSHARARGASQEAEGSAGLPEKEADWVTDG